MFKFYITILIFLPLLGFSVISFIKSSQEKIIVSITKANSFIQVLMSIILTFYLIVYSNNKQLFINLIDIYKKAPFCFTLSFYLDKISITFLLVGNIIFYLIFIFSKYYLHREEGFKRFYLALLLFYFSYNLTILSGNFETLMLGWEILGFCSFLLIAFYRERYFPITNSIKIFSLFRFGDLALTVVLWGMHHLFHGNFNFTDSNFEDNIKNIINENLNLSILIGLFIIITSCIKSAQIPFSFWLPRSMEGPTTSSAIFYGSLAIHLGVFVLLRTSFLWSNIFILKVIIFLVGLLSVIIAFFISRVQTTIKAQIAYSSITQIGFMFIEISLGLYNLVLIHFISNAFLRTYQLLISSSIVNIKIKEHIFNNIEIKKINTLSKFKTTIYLLSINEFYLNNIINLLFINPFIYISNLFKKLNLKTIFYTLCFILILFSLIHFNKIKSNSIINFLLPYLSVSFGIIGLMSSFSSNKNIYFKWNFILLNHFFIIIAFSHIFYIEINLIILYLSSIFLFFIIIIFILKKIKEKNEQIDFLYFNGLIHNNKKKAFIFLICSIGLFCFPISLTFFIQDYFLSKIEKYDFIILIFILTSYLINSILIINLFSQIFLGNVDNKILKTSFKYI